MRRVLALLAKVNETICGAAKNLAGLLLMAMLLIVVMQIVFRYVLNDSLVWSEELAKAMMVWTAFLVAAWTDGAGRQFALSGCLVLFYRTDHVCVHGPGRSRATVT